MDNRVYNILNWETDGDSKEFALIDIQDHSDRKFFWNYWHTNKEYLKSKGFSVSKNNDGNFYMYHVFDEEQIRLKKEKQKTLELSRSSGIEEDFPKPEGLDYFPYQKSAIAFANGRDATLIADEPGLGKTIEVSGIINSNSDIKTVLVICPASLRINWKRELEKWLINSYSVGIVDKSDYPDNADIVIINYDVVHRHHEELIKREWDLLVIDEVHFLKSPKSRRHKYIFGSNRQKIPAIKSKKKVFLTGTPIVNKPIELFPIIHNLDSVKWSNQWKFAHRYCDPKHNGYGWDFSGASNLDELQDELRSSVMIRRLKKDVLSELPAKFRQVIELPYSSSVAKLIDDELSEWSKREELLVQLKSSLVLARINEDNESYASAVESLKSGVSESFGSISRMREKVALAKVPYVVEHLKAIDHKVVVFAHHKSVVKKLAEEFEDECVVLVGDTSMKDRQEAVDRFQNDDKVKYFFGSITAAGVGITLTSASNVVFAELDWVPGNVSQAEDRCVLEGQPVLTPSGWVNIEDIKIGDFVISHDGKSHRVSDTFNRLARSSTAQNSKDITEINVIGWQKPLKFTSDHKVLTDKGWIEAGNIKPRDRILMPRKYDGDVSSVAMGNRISNVFKNSHGSYQKNSRLINLPEEINISDDFMFVCGYYIGDGFCSISNDKGRFVSFAGHVKQKDTYLKRCSDFIEQFGISCSFRKDKNSLGSEVRAYSGNLSFWFVDNFGRDFASKIIPEWVFLSSIRHRKSFIEGWLASDGYKRNNINEILTSSKRLAAQASRLLMSVGYKPCVNFNKHSGSYSIAWSESVDPHLKVTSVLTRTCNKTERVYDLTVDDSHTFVVGNAVVHNCHRVGQKNNVLVQHLVLEGSLDSKIAKTLIDKQSVIDKALDLEYSLEEPSVPDEVVVLPPEKELKKEAELVSDAEKVELLNQLKFLASFDCDNALASNGVGFNKFDTRIGSSLASQDYLTNRQAVLARKLLVKYANQLTRLGYD